jgi:hypothetical protein
MNHAGGRDAFGEAALRFAGVAAFPRLAYWLRWPTRLGPRGFIAYVVFQTVLIFVVRTWGPPYLKRLSDEVLAEKAELAERLGREPTEAELIEHFARD